MRALITGVSGQIGWYLAIQLELAGWKVYGLVQPHGGIHMPGGSEKAWVERELPGVTQVYGDLMDGVSVIEAIREVRPDVVFHLAALSQPDVVERQVEIGFQINVMGTIRLLNALNLLSVSYGQENRVPRLVHMSSDCVFGAQNGVKRGETPVQPTTAYGLSKAMAHLAVQQARMNGLAAANAVLFNATSPRQTTGIFAYVTKTVAAIKLGRERKLRVFRRDLLKTRNWLHAGDVASALVKIADKPNRDYVVCNATSHTIEGLCYMALEIAGLPRETLEIVDDGREDPIEAIAIGDAGPLLDLGWAPSVSTKEILEQVIRERCLSRE